ncbi:ABC transporter [Thermincola ferriacetica]|uniref:ABC transporter n=1 Tax=Thermincola ferriacetica TaxID=281456 RepID=A0A0L6W6A8_9FIRM|nr:ATP-binding cassette domain-containing protein [Thermincola ferriacetica]KNZ70991.1 ABC transporter [Thermincola ferriacetica]
MPIIETEKLTKEFKVFNRREGLLGAVYDLFSRRYHTVKAVHELDFTVEEGEMVGYIGANGAGKSTTIKMLTGILTPTSGKVMVNGYSPFKEREKCTRGIGVVFGQRSQLWWDIAVIESFKLLRRIYEVPEKAFRRRLADFTEILDLGPLLNLPVRKLSLGQRMRCELAAALLHNPPLLFLDEPTIGLDVLAKEKIRDFLKRINKEENTTILLTTHDLGDIEALCPRVAIIDHGRMIYDGTLESLLKRWGQKELEDIVKLIYQGYRPEGGDPGEHQQIPALPGINQA